MLSNIFKVIITNICMVIRLLTGNHIRWRFFDMVSHKAEIRTHKGGHILLGKICVIKPNAELTANGGNIILGDNCFVNRNSMIISHDSISIGKNTTIGPGVYIYDHDHDGNGGYISKPIVIEEGVWIGAGVIVLKGVKIGHDSIIAAGSIVKNDVEPNIVFVQKRSDTQLIRGNNQ